MTERMVVKWLEHLHQTFWRIAIITVELKIGVVVAEHHPYHILSATHCATVLLKPFGVYSWNVNRVCQLANIKCTTEHILMKLQESYH